MWVVIDKETKEVFYKGETYKQCLNYIDILHPYVKKDLNIVIEK